MAAVSGWQIQSVAIGWIVYARTDSVRALGWVGLAQFLPMLLFIIPGGVLADRFERRMLLVIGHVCLALTSLLLGYAAKHPEIGMAPVYTALAFLGTSRALTGPASQAMLPTLVPKEAFPRAVAAASVVLNLATLVGPALGGFLYGVFDRRGSVEHVFQICAGLFAIATLLLMFLPRGSAGAGRASIGLRAVADGARYVWSNKPVLGALSLDLFAVLLGGAVALLPVYTKKILHAGPEELGFLRSASSLGAIAVAVWLTAFPLKRKAGPIMFGSVLVFGLATVVFGVSTWVPLSVAALFIVGASDMVSVQIRHTLVQLHTPDAMRGRVSAVNMVFISASNELGEFESGTLAGFIGPVAAVVFGGIGTCGVVLLWLYLFPTLRKMDALDGGAATT